MSAKNRGTKGVEFELYETRPWCVWRLLDAIASDLDSEGRWLEPCVGNGAIVGALTTYYGSSFKMAKTVDINPEMGADITADYLQTRFSSSEGERFDVGITNPPFSKAHLIAAKMISECNIVCMYQRLNWLASVQRHRFFEYSMPSVYVLPNRPSHQADGKTDATDYAWIVWGLEANKIRWLGCTDRQFRRF